MTSRPNPELGRSLVIDGVSTNFHEAGRGAPVLLLHGSGPGVSAWANWRLNLPELAQRFRVVAPDLLGFGYTGPAPGVHYTLEGWLRHLLGLLEALDLPHAHVVGNSFGGALALALAVRHPERVGRLVLMGSAGLSFPITSGLDQVWGYTPSVANMRALLDLFAFDRGRVTDELAELRYRASIRPGVQENFAAMFPAPRQRWVDALAQPEGVLAKLPHETLILHGREDRVIPLATSERLFRLIPRAQLHLFGGCGHWTQIEHAGRFNRLVGAFLAE
jgi:2-hydroxymuconate-semialdehyde hydrolase